jgi:Holliday junction resolvase RusA-like endonuclease
MKLIIPFKLLSYNQYYRNSKTGKRIKTGAGLAYDEELGLFFEDNTAVLSFFRKGIDLSSNILEFKIHNFNSNYYIKDGSRLNQTSGDIDNYVKVLQDKLFKALDMDDYLIKRLLVEESPSDTDYAIIELNIL